MTSTGALRGLDTLCLYLLGHERFLGQTVLAMHTRSINQTRVLPDSQPQAPRTCGDIDFVHGQDRCSQLADLPREHLVQFHPTPGGRFAS